MITIIPMAGAGARFAAAGYAKPKALLPMPDGRPLISWVIGRLTKGPLFTIGMLRDQRTLTTPIIVARIRAGTSGGRLLWIQERTGGPLATILTARRYLAGRDELLISYCDCFLSEGGIGSFLEAARGSGSEAVAAVFETDDPRFGRTPDGRWADGGIFWFREACLFLRKASRISSPTEGARAVAWQCSYSVQPRADLVDLGAPTAYEAFLASRGTVG